MSKSWDCNEVFIRHQTAASVVMTRNVLHHAWAFLSCMNSCLHEMFLGSCFLRWNINCPIGMFMQIDSPLWNNRFDSNSKWMSFMGKRWKCWDGTSVICTSLIDILHENAQKPQCPVFWWGRARAETLAADCFALPEEHTRKSTQ